MGMQVALYIFGATNITKTPLTVKLSGRTMQINLDRNRDTIVMKSTQIKVDPIIISMNSAALSPS